MALRPKPSDIPKILNALKLYRVTSIITGTFLLLLCLMMVFRYILHVDIELGGSHGFLALVPRDLIRAYDLSTGILIAHGWFYVLYLYSDFRLWSLMRWRLSRFLVIALGGVIPFLSFIVERRMHGIVLAELAEIGEAPEKSTAEKSTAEKSTAEKSTAEVGN
jgi:integral membrane protein